MWVLIDANIKRSYPILPFLCEYTVGRKNTDIVIVNDPSISRDHAKFTKHNNSEDILLQDTSKYGTYVNEKRIHSEMLLTHEVDIKFGIQNANFKLIKLPPIYLTTSLLNTTDEKASLIQMCKALNITPVPDWWISKASSDNPNIVSQGNTGSSALSLDISKNCDYLVMKHIYMTPKVLSALITNKPIVTLEFLQDWLKAYENSKAPQCKEYVKPDPKNYIPEIKDLSILRDASFNVTDHSMDRSNLFHGLSFMFMYPNQFTKYHEIIRAGRGSSKLITTFDQYFQEISVLINQIMRKNNKNIKKAKTDVQSTFRVVLIYNENDNNIYNINDNKEISKIIEDWTTNQDQRLISESEICCAILTNSTAVYCNPDLVSESSSALQNSTKPLPTNIYKTNIHKDRPNNTPILHDSFTTPKQQSTSKPQITFDAKSSHHNTYIKNLNNNVTPKHNNNSKLIRNTPSTMKSCQNVDTANDKSFPFVTNEWCDVSLIKKQASSSTNFDNSPLLDSNNLELGSDIESNNCEQPAQYLPIKKTFSCNSNGWLSVCDKNSEKSDLSTQATNQNCSDLTRVPTNFRKFRKAFDPSKLIVYLEEPKDNTDNTKQIPEQAYSTTNKSQIDNKKNQCKTNNDLHRTNNNSSPVNTINDNINDNKIVKKPCITNKQMAKNRLQMNYNIQKESKKEDPSNFFNFSIRPILK